MQPSKTYSTKIGGLQKADVYLKHNQTSKMGLEAKVVDDFSLVLKKAPS